jgi:hypothetical protein
MPAPVPANHYRQILRDLTADYGRQVNYILQAGELLKGSVYEIQTRCGNPSCHCAKPRGLRHAATVRSWSENGRTHTRSVPAPERARVRRLTAQYRRLRQARTAVIQLQRQILRTIDLLEVALRLPPPASASDNTPLPRTRSRRPRG